MYLTSLIDAYVFLIGTGGLGSHLNKYLALLFILISPLYLQRLQFAKGPLLLYFLIFFLLWIYTVSISLISSITQGYSFDFSIFFPQLASSLVLSLPLGWYLQTNSAAFKRATQSFSLGFILILLLAIFGIGITYADTQTYSRILIWNNSNPFAFDASIFLVFQAFLVQYHNKPKRYVPFVCSLITYLFLLRTGSRTGLLAFLPSALYLQYSIFNPALIRLPLLLRRFLFFGFFFTLLSVSLFLSTDTTLFVRLSEFLNDGEDGGRILISTSYITELLSSPMLLTGHGVPGFWRLSDTIFHGFPVSPHNGFLEILGYAGLPGLFLLTASVFIVISSSIVLVKHRSTLALLLIPYLAILLSGQPFSSRSFWLCSIILVQYSTKFSND